jgi:hypothetical protein
MTTLAKTRLGGIATSIGLILSIVSMTMADRIVGGRGRSIEAWIWLAALFGPLAALAAWPRGAKRMSSHCLASSISTESRADPTVL